MCSTKAFFINCLIEALKDKEGIKIFTNEFNNTIIRVNTQYGALHLGGPGCGDDEFTCVGNKGSTVKGLNVHLGEPNAMDEILQWVEVMS